MLTKHYDFSILKINNQTTRDTLWRNIFQWCREKQQKKFGPFLDLCVSSLRRGHANLLCIVPILSDVPEGTKPMASSAIDIALHYFFTFVCGTPFKHSLSLYHIKTSISCTFTIFFGISNILWEVLVFLAFLAFCWKLWQRRMKGFNKIYVIPNIFIIRVWKVLAFVKYKLKFQEILNHSKIWKLIYKHWKFQQ